MKKNTDADFFQQALAAFDTPAPPKMAVARERMQSKAQPASDSPRDSHGKVFAVLAVLTAVLLLLAVTILEFDSVALTVTHMDREEGQFYGVDPEGNGYLVVWENLEDFARYDIVKVFYYRLRNISMPDPFFTSSLKLWDKVWAWSVTVVEKGEVPTHGIFIN